MAKHRTSPRRSTLGVSVGARPAAIPRATDGHPARTVLPSGRAGRRVASGTLAAVIHPSADVSADATIGQRTSIWNRVQVREGAVIGDDCIVGKDAYVDFGVHIGDRCKIQNGALVYHGVTVEPGVFIGPGAILTNDRFPRSITPDGALAGPDDWTVSTITLRYGCSIGAGAVVVAGNDVGRFATVGAGAVVTRPVPDYALVAGNPARRLGWVCACGQRLTDSSGRQVAANAEGEASCPACRRHFTIAAESCTERVVT
jgi:acetyltransferase-like isoleucine patch superfamily enzyme